MSLLELPDELLIKIIDETNYGWEEGEDCLNALALTCRRLNSITTPTLYKEYLMYDDQHRLGTPVPALFLRTLLRNPSLGSHLRAVQFSEKRVVTWNYKMNNGNGVDISVFAETDYPLAEAAIHKLCEQPIWRFPAGQPTDEETWGDFQSPQSTWTPHSNPQPTALPFEKDIFAADWLRCIKEGHYDAVYALILSFTPNIIELHIKNWTTNWGFVDDDSGRTHDMFGPPPPRIVNDYISQFMHAVAQSQKNCLDEDGQLSGGNDQRELGRALLPRLKEVWIDSFSDTSTVPIAIVMPFLLPPSVTAASLKGLWDANWFPKSPSFPVLSITTLKLEMSLLDAESFGHLIRSCPQLEWLHYSQWKQPLSYVWETGPVAPEQVNLSCKDLQPYLDSVRQTLRYFDMGIVAEADARAWNYAPENEEGQEMWSGEFDFSRFEKLETLFVNWDNITTYENLVDGPPDSLAAVLPLRSLKTLVIRKDGWNEDWLQWLVRSLLYMRNMPGLTLKEVVLLDTDWQYIVDFVRPDMTKLQNLCVEMNIELVHKGVVLEDPNPQEEEDMSEFGERDPDGLAELEYDMDEASDEDPHDHDDFEYRD